MSHTPASIGQSRFRLPKALPLLPQPASSTALMTYHASSPTSPGGHQYLSKPCGNQMKRYLTSMRTLAMKLALLFASHVKPIVCHTEQPASKRPPIPVPITHPFAILNTARAAGFLSPTIVRPYSDLTHTLENLDAKPKPAALKSLFFTQHFEPAQLRVFDSCAGGC
ncbi:uncharacterized protein HD556DRAFT_747917 [Suillus plorans]|uniref:Uncharacterized protein n=1 Tax=Suillus plorans TaxID=116603 RepID=A0A9P7DEW3_9AGAM|nr:uncharacterized protein HD556DRAFT_747917 [Suillus plorans]KAG1790085.1 hypothetical protein HD556DRAFT_747917 [Suillus plorans]